MQSFSTAIEARPIETGRQKKIRAKEKCNSFICVSFSSSSLRAPRSSFFLFFLFFFLFWPTVHGKESIVLPSHSYLCALWKTAPAPATSSPCRSPFPCPRCSCVQCTCQSLIEGKIAVWLADSGPLFPCECVRVAMCVWMRHIFPATWQKSLQRCSNKVKAKEKKLRVPCSRCSKWGI